MIRNATSTIMIQVVENPDADVLQEVSDYLSKAPASSGACGEHDPRWLDVLRIALRHKPIVLIARNEDSDGICGYLPLALVASRLFGRFLVSLPYLNRAGVVAEDDDVASALVDHAVELAVAKNVQYLELRHHGEMVERLKDHASLGMSVGEKVRMVLDLPDTAEPLWKSIGPKVRNQVRKGEKHDLSIRWGGADCLDDFYDIFAVNMRDLGTPVYSKRLFSCILEKFPNQTELAVVQHQDQAIAAALLVHDEKSTQVPSASSLREFSKTNANMWMYHQLLLRAIERGSKQFDFGRSSEGAGTYRFKKQWGAQPQPTLWQYHICHGDVGSMRPDNPKNRRRVETWQKMPVWLTRRIGPMIVRGIP